MGIFSDYNWNKDLDSFKRYNLIYGWNGCGKTTLSKLFLALENGELVDYENLEYEIETDDGIFKQGKVFIKKVRVFTEELNTEEIEKYSLALKQQEKPKVALIDIGNISKELDELIKKGNILLPLYKQSL